MAHHVLPVEAVYGGLAARQHGVVTISQLARLGLSPGAINRRVKTGLLIKMLPGVYRLTGVPRSWHQRAMAVYLWAGEESLIAGSAAAALHRLDGCALPSAITVLTPRSLKPPHHLVVVRRPGMFSGRVREVIQGIDVTDCARTLIHLAAEVSEAQLELALEDARRRRLITAALLEEVLG